MTLNKLRLQDKKLFEQFLLRQPHELSVYAFENIYIWKRLFDISWLVIEDNLCIFFKDKIGCFLYLASSGNDKNPEVTKKIFETLDKLNQNKEFGAIENIEEKDVSFYQGQGLDCQIKSYEYLFLREDLAGLKGNKFKSKRSSLNYFIKHNDFQYLQFSATHRDECLKLYDLWKQGRKLGNGDLLYCGMLEDTSISLTTMLEHYNALDIVGRVVKIGKDIKGFTFGFKLNPHTFCILYEITDLAVKGLAQFIFCSFCRELKNYKYINIMDDSGLENLKNVKLSYHPQRLIPTYIAKRRTNQKEAQGA